MGQVKKLTEPLMPADEQEVKPKLAKRKSAAGKVEDIMKGAADMADDKEINPAVGTCLRVSSPVVAVVVRAAVFVGPVVVSAYAFLFRLYEAAPKNVLKMLFGVALCFFGGTFVASLAAVAAFQEMGWQQTYADLVHVYTEAKVILEASSKDDVEDLDRDGVSDVEQLTPVQLTQRKIVLGMRTIKEPKKLETAIAGLWGAYLAVLATLRLQFAQTVALALGLYESVRVPFLRVLAPPLILALKPASLEHWTETLLDSVAKFLAITIAWYIQMVISAFYSALRGGRIFALALCDVVQERGWNKYVEKLPGVVAPFDPDTSYFDEAVGYTLAASGVFWQLTTGFNLPFPLNVIFLPLTIIEWFLRWQMTFGGPVVGGESTAASG